MLNVAKWMREQPNLRQFVRDVKMVWVHRKLGLKSVHRTCYVNKSNSISPDLIAGAYSYVGEGCWICPNVEIGKYVMFAPHCAILGGDHHMNTPGTPIIFSGRPDVPKTIIEDDVWIGYRSIVSAGIKIGRGAIVAAGAIVTKDVDPYSIVGGNPAKLIKMRFCDNKDILNHDQMLDKEPVLGNFALPKKVQK